MSIKKKVFRGGIALTIRRILSAFLSLIGTLFIARILGPEKYGVVSVSLGMYYFFSFIGRMGLHAYILRAPELFKEDAEQILAFYCTVGLLFCSILWLGAPIAGLWSGNSEVPIALRYLIPAVWFDMLAVPSSCMLQRNLEFGKYGLIYALAEVSNYIVSIIAVLLYQSYLGVVLGYIVQYVLFAVLAHFSHPIRLRFRWNWKTLAPACRYGFSFSSSNWISNLRSLTIPVFVSRFAGIEAAGVANIALRVAQKLLLLRAVIRNMSITVMAKLLDNHDSLKRALNKGMLYQVLCMGPICALFSGFSTWIIPTMFGDEWLLSAQIFPFIGFSIVVSALFDLQSAVLYASDHNREVIRFSIFNIGVIWLSCFLLLPVIGVWGYCFAETIALLTYYSIHRSLVKYFKAPNYWPVLWSLLATIPPLFGGLFLPALPNLLLMFISYGALICLCKPVREALSDLAGNRLKSLAKTS